MRQTPGSLLDARAIPPEKARLLAAAAELLEDDLTVAARALSKHAPRASGGFWGEVRGSVAEKNRAALAVVEAILGAATWWNVFEHYKHGVVYEARAASGHGVRFSGDGARLIGFLEPFFEEEA
jgi:hypothetical protein